MSQPTGIKLCECGCGRPAPIAKKNVPRLGHIKGQPIRFIYGHNGHKLSGSEPKLFVAKGERFGCGVVIDAKAPHVLPSGRVLRGARLLCDCGNAYTAEIADVVNGRKNSCGCGRGRHSFIDRAGQRYGRLIVLRRAENKPDGNTAWLCRCDCGEEVVVRSASLSRGSKSCGCRGKRPGNGFLPGQAALNKVLDGYRRSARDRDLSWKLTKEAFYRLTGLDCFYCGTPPATVAKQGPYGGKCLYNGIDRKDNARGYVAGNVVPCCWICNHAKMDMPYDEFMAWIGRLTEHRRLHPEPKPPRILKIRPAELEARFG